MTFDENRGYSQQPPYVQNTRPEVINAHNGNDDPSKGGKQPKKRKKLSGTSIGSRREKLKRTLKPVGTFVSKHKVIVSIVCVIVVLVAATLGVANHFLNKINYTDGKVSVARNLLQLSTGEVIDITGLTRNPDGTYTLPDGRRIDSDGTIWNVDGSIIFYDGSYLTPDGLAVLSDGTTIYKDASVVFQDGYRISNASA